MIQPLLKRNDKTAYGIIITLSVVVFSVVVALGKIKLLGLNLGFDPHVFARANAYINSTVAMLLILGLILVKQKNYAMHRAVMLTAFGFSSLFLVSYILHHLLTADTPYGGDETFKHFVYYPLLISHIFLAATILPFILLTTYRGLTSDFKNHKKIARITYPIWLYVSISGVIVYLLVSPYYSHL